MVGYRFHTISETPVKCPYEMLDCEINLVVDSSANWANACMHWPHVQGWALDNIPGNVYNLPSMMSGQFETKTAMLVLLSRNLTVF